MKEEKKTVMTDSEVVDREAFFKACPKLATDDVTIPGIGTIRVVQLSAGDVETIGMESKNPYDTTIRTIQKTVVSGLGKPIFKDCSEIRGLPAPVFEALSTAIQTVNGFDAEKITKKSAASVS